MESSVGKGEVSVIYITGSGRSGSTILELLLGRLTNMVAVGELRHIWERGFEENQLCGCGTPFRECEFWHRVVMEAFGGFDRIDPLAMREAQLATSRIRHIPRWLLPGEKERFRDEFAAYFQAISRLYRAILNVSGRKILVDSSKIPAYGFALNAVSDLDMNFIHLVRDSRAVAYSWMRKRVRPEIHWKLEYMPRFGPLYTAGSWSLTNSLAELLAHTHRRYIQLRYEDVATDPRGTLSRILAWMCWPEGSDGAVRACNFELGVNHTVSGNPIRFHQDSIAIRADVEWQQQMSDGQKLLVTILTWPYLLRYRYFYRKHV